MNAVLDDLASTWLTHPKLVPQHLLFVCQSCHRSSPERPIDRPTDSNRLPNGLTRCALGDPLERDRNSLTGRSLFMLHEPLLQISQTREI
jgi:hypothetical protein